jgi:hypothetical protein
VTQTKPDDGGDETIGPPEAQLEPPPADEEEYEYEDDARGPVGSRAATMVALGCAVLIALSLLWIGGEMHYRNCLDAAELRVGTGVDDLSRLARSQAVDSCSRSPF